MKAAAVTTAPDTSSSVVDPTAPGYQYMSHSVFRKVARAAAAACAWLEGVY